MADDKPAEDSRGLVFFVNNHHAGGCGRPPAISGDQENRYFSYFENDFGEQAVFVYEFETEKGTLWMGDAGWETPWEVVDGRARGLVLGQAEALWLRACWTAIELQRKRGNSS